MNVGPHIAAGLCQWIRRRTCLAREPDLIIGDPAHPYLLRWYVIPRNRLFNVYLHHFVGDDDDRALHDHPWFWCSLLLRGLYVEHTRLEAQVFRTGDVRVHSPWFAHRLSLLAPEGCWTLFITGPRLRSWGFHCPNGWVHWRRFTDPATGGRTVGRGCEG